MARIRLSVQRDAVSRLVDRAATGEPVEQDLAEAVAMLDALVAELRQLTARYRTTAPTGRAA